MGNHEMYSGGHSYFKTFLPKLGLFDADKKIISPQSASFFCLETDHWVILGLDTGYHAGGIPALSDFPGINSIPCLNVNARFDDIMMRWLTADAAHWTEKKAYSRAHAPPTVQCI